MGRGRCTHARKLSWLRLFLLNFKNKFGALARGNHFRQRLEAHRRTPATSLSIHACLI
jgi:hypothetical protein